MIAGATATGSDLVVLALNGISNPDAYQADGKSFGLAEFGGMIKYLKQQKCSHVCMAGDVPRPDFAQLKPDMKALKYLPGAIAAAKDGDDALLTYLVSIFEKQGFEIISPQELCESLLIGEGPMGAVDMAEIHHDDALKACEIARDMGVRDIGQGAVICGGLVLAVEAQEGTDQMLERVASLPQAKRGDHKNRKGVLAKMVKPGQEERVDLPTIGLRTVELADKAGLAGIVVESGRAFCIDRDAAIKAADEAGIFILGLAASKAT